MNLIHASRLDYKTVLRPLYEMNFAHSHAASPYFKQGGECACLLLLHLEASCPTYGCGFPYADVSNKRNAMLCALDKACGVLDFSSGLCQSTYKRLPHTRPY